MPDNINHHPIYGTGAQRCPFTGEWIETGIGAPTEDERRALREKQERDARQLSELTVKLQPIVHQALIAEAERLGRKLTAADVAADALAAFAKTLKRDLV